MCRTLFFTFLTLLFSSSVSSAQELPKENSVLNYRIVGFYLPKLQPNQQNVIEIAQGRFNDPDSFNQKIILTTPLTGEKTIIKVPAFGQEYSWRCVDKEWRQRRKNDAAIHHFQTGFIPAIDTAQMRLRILQPAKKYTDGYVFLDGHRALYDMNGEPVWYLPDIDGFITEKSILRDLKLTNRGTVTFMYEEKGAYEVNYDGEILWKAPNDGAVSGQKKEYYHHELTRLSNGHFMILGCEYEKYSRQFPVRPDSLNFSFSDENLKKDTGDVKMDSTRAHIVDIPFGTVIEYNEAGKVVWNWKSSGYFKTPGIPYHITRTHKPEVAPHENSFYLDEKSGYLYVGFRNISRIVKIKYPEGKVVASWGDAPDWITTGNTSGVFCRQHSVRTSEKGYIYLYNNNSCFQAEGISSILKLKEETTGDLTPIWTYQCTTEGATVLHPGTYKFPIGGNVNELADGTLFINMSSTYSKVFLLSGEKEILWSAIPEKLNPVSRIWEMTYQYRAAMISSKSEFESLVWSALLK